MSEIRTSGPLLFTEPDCPTRVGEIINTLSEIYDIPMPRLGMSVYVKDEGVNYTITKLEPKLIEGVLVPDAKVAEYELQTGKSIAWNSSSNVNDYVVAGVYNITGERLNVNDGLPIANSDPGHTISARLVVLDSSITGTGDSQDKCITQVLTLSNRTGEDGNMYIRTGSGVSLNSLSWKPWATLQTNINVDTVDNLDNLKDNGIYSGVWTKGSYNNYPLTFVCIVINDYIVDIEPRRISQFVYGLSKLNGTVVYQTRVWDDSKSVWGDWEILNQKEIAKMISDEIAKVVADAPETFDTLREIAEWIEYHGTEAADMLAAINANATAISNEISRAKTAEQELESKSLHYNSINAIPTANNVQLGGKSVDGTNTLLIDIPSATTERAGVMTAADKMKLNNLAVEGTDTDLNTYFHEGVYLFRHTLLTNAPIPSDSVVSARLTVLTAYDGKSPVITQVLNLNDLSDGEGNIYIRSHQNDTWKPWGKLQTNVEVEQIIQEEKKRAEAAEQALANDIANAPNLALRALFIAAGAEYNDTDQVIEKTITFPAHLDGSSETIVISHMPHRYYLGGIGDITESQMRYIYNLGGFALETASRKYILQSGNVTILPLYGKWPTTYLAISMEQAFYGASSLKSIQFTNGDAKVTVLVTNLKGAFEGVQTLKYVLQVLKISYSSDTTIFKNTFYNNFALEEVRISGLCQSVSFAQSPNITRGSILYAIEYAAPRTDITITLHGDAYARLSEDANIVAALAAQPLITLASA